MRQGDRILRVNHAGEHGAVNIYAGQIIGARWTAPHMVDELIAFKSHEQKHRAIFAAELERRSRRRCRSYHLCGLGGWTLGLVTGLLGKNAIAATTAAVEAVVLRHLEQQLSTLGNDTLQHRDIEAVAAISAIIADEQAHHDHASDQIQTGTFWPRVLTPVVSASTEAVIWLGMRM